MIDLLIPFGIDRSSGGIVEPEDAPRGRTCNCLCPGCRAPVLSRHPKKNRRHFAHDSKHELAKPEEACPFNPAVAVAMMAKELASSLSGKALRTPAYEAVQEYACCRDTDVVLVASESRVVINSASASVAEYSHAFDLKFVVGGYPIFVDLVYKGKPAMTLRESDLQAVKVGVLAINCDSFSTDRLKNNRSVRFSQVVAEFLLDTGYREWRFHPRTTIVAQKARDEHKCRDRHTDLRVPIDNRVRDTRSYSPPELKQNHLAGKRFYCVICDREWVQQAGSNWCCPECKSHLYAREIVG